MTATEVVTTIPAETVQTGTQTDDRQHDKLVQINNKLKRALQGLKDKIHRFALDRPDLFVGIGEETSERLDNLIFSVENQATQIDKLQDHVNELERLELNLFYYIFVHCQANVLALWKHCETSKERLHLRKMHQPLMITKNKLVSSSKLFCKKMKSEVYCVNILMKSKSNYEKH